MMNIRLNKLLLGAAVLLGSLPAAAQRGAASDSERLWEYWGKSEIYLAHETDVLLDLVDRTLAAYPPVPRPAAERQLALAALDAVLHQPRNDDSAALQAFLARRISRLPAELDSPLKKKGLDLWKVYNDGFIVRSRSLTLGFDLCGTRGGRKIVPDSLMRELVGRCDALFISHRDPDHADRTVTAMAAEAGIPVYGPEDFRDAASVPVRMEDFAAADLPVRGGRTVRVHALPGHQDELQNNIYVVSFPEGCSFAHCGDQYRESDLVWLRDAAARLDKAPDVLVIDCWAMDMQETILGFRPGAVVLGHENEIGHGIDHREAFWLSQYKLDAMQLPMPAYILAWGEHCRFR